MAKSSVVEFLQVAQMYVAAGWTQGTYARDARGKDVAPGSPDAVCWCAEGAVAAAMEVLPAVPYFPHFAKVISPLAKTISPLVPETVWVCVWNDTPGRTQDEVLDTFSRAIEIAEREGL